MFNPLDDAVPVAVTPIPGTAPVPNGEVTVGLLFAFGLYVSNARKPEGTEKMKEIGELRKAQQVLSIRGAA